MNLQGITKRKFLELHKLDKIDLVDGGSHKLETVLNYIDKNPVIHTLPKGRMDLDKHWTCYEYKDFILVINDMQGSDYSKEYFKDTGKQNIVTYRRK